jgi:hypothetical protein
MNPVTSLPTTSPNLLIVEHTNEFKNVKISRLMLELYERIIPVLQKLASSERIFSDHEYRLFKKDGDTESSQQKYRGMISFVNLLGIAGGEQVNRVVGVVTASCSEIAQGYITATQSSKVIHQQALSHTEEHRSTVLSFIEKLLSALQEIIRNERNSG